MRDWKLIDELWASFSRPYSIYACATSIGISLPLSIYFKSGDLVVGALAATAGGVVTGTAYFRTMDKKSALAAATEDLKTKSAATTTDKASDRQTEAIMAKTGEPA